jgi:hypothetical protein
MSPGCQTGGGWRVGQSSRPLLTHVGPGRDSVAYRQRGTVPGRGGLRFLELGKTERDSRSASRRDVASGRAEGEGTGSGHSRGPRFGRVDRRRLRRGWGGVHAPLGGRRWGPMRVSRWNLALGWLALVLFVVVLVAVLVVWLVFFT